jgi:hypothetical protein
MNASHQNVRHASVLLIHGDLEAHGSLEYSPANKCLEIVLPPSGVFSTEPEERIRLTKAMLDHLEIMPDGNVRINY